MLSPIIETLIFLGFKLVGDAMPLFLLILPLAHFGIFQDLHEEFL